MTDVSNILPEFPPDWLQIESLDIEAQGIAHRLDGKVVFVEGALPFEVVSANVNRKKNNWEQATVTGYDRKGEQFTATMIVYVAAAYRTPDDSRPGIGTAWEVFPGRTPYTAGSELMNAGPDPISRASGTTP